MSDIQFRASRLLQKIGRAPIIWNEQRDVVHITLEKEDYAKLLRLLTEISEESEEYVEQRRVRI